MQIAAWPSASSWPGAPSLCLRTSPPVARMHPATEAYNKWRELVTGRSVFIFCKSPQTTHSLTGIIWEPCILLMAACACCRLENLMKAQPRLSPSRSLSTVTSSTVPYGSNMALTSSSLAVLESMPTNTLRSSSGSKQRYSHTHTQ